MAGKLVADVSRRSGATVGNSANPDPESRHEEADESQHEEAGESRHEESDGSQQEEPDAERRLMCVNTGLIGPMVCDANRVVDSSLIWIVGAFMRSSVQHRITKHSPSAMPFINTLHLRTSLG